MRLDGQRIYLRPLAWDDTDLILRWRRDPEVVNQLFTEGPRTRQEHEAWFAKLQQGNARIEFAIVVREIEQPVGTIGLSRIDRRHGKAEYGILIGESEWRGRGIAREASDLILRYAFERLNLQTVTLNLFADNAAARALYERLGFVEDSILAGEREKDGLRRKTVGMWLSRERWLQRA